MKNLWTSAFLSLLIFILHTIGIVCVLISRRLNLFPFLTIQASFRFIPIFGTFGGGFMMSTVKNLTPEQRLATAGCRIICVVLLQDEHNRCIYRVYTSDGGFIDYTGFQSCPVWVRDWMNERNTFEHVIPSCMFISGVSING